MTSLQLHVHQWLPASRANGPGLRAVVWVQGCSLGCPGCFNPTTHPFGAGETWPVERLAAAILERRNELEGVTVSGGEPFQQSKALAAFLAIVRRESHLSTLVFSGYCLEELASIRYAPEALRHVDLLLAGRYEAAQRLARDLLGSANKTAHFLTARYSPTDLAGVPAGEALIEPNGEIHLTGIDPLVWPTTPPPMTI
jgi:anaerobic ribonucleoside-triphosphate reductase activating protein